MKHAIENNDHITRIQTLGQQRGAVLVLGLILLLILTLLGVSTMQGSVFDEKMAGNAKDRNFAFQSAESALRGGELWLQSNPSQPLATAGGSNGVWSLNGPGAGSWWQSLAAPWSNGSPSVVTSSGISYVNAQPQRIIEEGQFVRDSLAIGQQQSASGLNFYRVTARAEGGSDKAVVQLQSMYSRRY